MLSGTAVGHYLLYGPLIILILKLEQLRVQPAGEQPVVVRLVYP